MISIILIINLTFIFVIQRNTALRCYSCNGIKQCDFLSSKLHNENVIHGDDLHDACSITRESNGSIVHGIKPLHTCRSSSNEFCCNQDLCNVLYSPPLPAFTSLTCALNLCQTEDKQCNHTNNTVAYRSSATDSCVEVHHGNTYYKSYKRSCSSEIALLSPAPDEKLQFNSSTCCYAPWCNRQRFLPSKRILHCYTCDSRITGLKGCNILDTSSPHVYDSITFDSSESCAIIVGLAGQDFMTGYNYTTFTIRTFIRNCTNQSLGIINYGGASFRGHINCCTTSLCNIEPLYLNLSSSLIFKLENISVFLQTFVPIMTILLGFIFMVIGIKISMYRYKLKKLYKQYIPVLVYDAEGVVTVLRAF